MRYRERKEKKCLNCCEMIPNRNTFCNNKCQGEYEFINKTLPRFQNGEIFERDTLKKILIYFDGDKCSICDITNWNGKKITLQVDHIDGNCGNNGKNNLRLLCPNCHSQTDTWGNKNKGNGRRSKGLPLR